MRFDLSAQEEADERRDWRSKRFRILVCIDGSDEAYAGLRFAAEIGQSEECDIILAYVRPGDQGLRTGGLQLRVVRENMLDWGLELPGIKHLKRGFDMLIEAGHMEKEWDATHTHTDVWGDPLGDNKIEYRHENGKSVVLKLKTAPDAVSGILDQYELGPYNLIIMGPPKRWRGEIRALREPSAVQKIAMLAPSSVLTVRGPLTGGGFLLCTDGSEQSMESMRRGAVLAHCCGEPVGILAVARDDSEIASLERKVEHFKTDLEATGITVDDATVALGSPVRTIIEAGKSRSVIVVSDSGKSKITRFFAGSVAFDVMGKSGTSVLNIR